MDEIKYEVVQIPFETVGLSVRILRMDKKDDIESELAIFSRDRCIVSKVHYEDYILSVYIINLGQLLYFINSNKDLISSFDKFREELINKLYDINPMLNPGGLLINQFGILKIDDGEYTIDGYPFVENKSWDTIIASETAEFDGKDINSIVGPEEGNDIEDDDKKQVLNDLILTTAKEVNNIKHAYKKRWWDRLTMYIIIREFDNSVINDVIALGNYNDKESYTSFIVTSFVKDIESVFAFIDHFGLLTKLTPQQTLDEIYNLCLSVNPGIDYDKLGKKTNNVSSSCKKVTQKKEYKALKDIDSSKMLELDINLSKRVIGQEDAISVIVKAIKRSRIGIKEPGCPIGSFLLAGKTGVGKTLLSKVLADDFFKKEADGGFIRIDCSEYSADHEYAKLIGSPAGYVRSEEGGVLTNAVMKNPFSVVLFDEVEKASEKVHQLMLQIMDEGRLTDNHGEVVSFKDTLILMTSNIGAKDIQSIKSTIGFGEVNKVTNKRKNIVISKAITDSFKPEFLNRLTSIIYFNNIDRSTCSKIVDIELDKINNYINNKNLYIDFSKSVKRLILNEGYSESFGAREVKRTVDKLIADTLADYLIENNIEKEAVFNTKVKNKKVIYTKGKALVDFVSNNNHNNTEQLKCKTCCK